MPTERDQNEAAVRELAQLVDRGLPLLTAARRVRRLSRTQLAALVNLSDVEIARLEIGTSQIEPHLDALSEALQLPADVLAGRDN